MSDIISENIQDNNNQNLVEVEELWKDIPNHESLYEISNHARIRNKKTGKILKNFVTVGKYQNKKQYTIRKLMGEV